jgi:hypothetical protein
MTGHRTSPTPRVPRHHADGTSCPTNRGRPQLFPATTPFRCRFSTTPANTPPPRRSCPIAPRQSRGHHPDGRQRALNRIPDTTPRPLRACTDSFRADSGRTPRPPRGLSNPARHATPTCHNRSSVKRSQTNDSTGDMIGRRTTLHTWRGPPRHTQQRTQHTTYTAQTAEGAARGGSVNEHRTA